MREREFIRFCVGNICTSSARCSSYFWLQTDIFILLRFLIVKLLYLCLKMDKCANGLIAYVLISYMHSCSHIGNTCVYFPSMTSSQGARYHLYGLHTHFFLSFFLFFSKEASILFIRFSAEIVLWVSLEVYKYF